MSLPGFPAYDQTKCFDCGRADGLSADIYLEVTRGPLSTSVPVCGNCAKLRQAGRGPAMSVAILRQRSK